MTALVSGSAVVVHIDHTLKIAWAAALAKLKKAKADDASSFKARYAAVAEILNHTPPLYLAGGLATEADFLESVLKEDHSTAYRHLRIASLCTTSDLETFGPSILDLAIRCLEAKKGRALTPKDRITFSTLTFAVKNAHGKPVHIALEHLTVGQLRELLRTERGHSKSVTLPEAKTVARLLSATSAKHATYSASKQGLTLHVPWNELSTAAAALATFSR